MHEPQVKYYVWHCCHNNRRMLKMAIQQGRSERRGEAYASYVEPLNDARTPLADFFSILLGNIEQPPVFPEPNNASNKRHNTNL
jgi:hypothetical protein